MDVKSLFKSGKKAIKAFKVSSGPAVDAKDESKPSDTPLEAWEAPSVPQPATAVNVNVDMEDYKAEIDQATLKPTVSWAQVAEEPVLVVEKASTSAYVPPSQRRAESAKAMPSVAEAVTKLSTGSLSKSGASVSGPAPTRLKLITSASKKAMEEEERKKVEEKKRKEAEKLARREELKADLQKNNTESLQHCEETVQQSLVIQAATLEEIYAKYANRVKTGRKLEVVV